MKKFTIIFFPLFILFFNLAYAYNTPGTGVKWNLDDLVANSGGVVTFGSGVYTFNDTVKIQRGDTFYVSTDAVVKIAANKIFAVSGVIFVNPPTSFLVTALDTNNRFTGMRLDSNNVSEIRKMTFEYASGSLRIADCSPTLDSCIFQKNNTVTTFANGTIAVFRANPVIKNCQFLYNQRAAIQGGANISNAPKIISCYFLGNNVLNQNVPQINIGATGADTCKILNCQILRASTNSGGIGFLPLAACNVLINGNVIKNNRYGINLQGGNAISAVISYNQIDSNNTQGNPALGGSGIAFSGGSASSQQNSIVTGNLIRWNLWGVTIQGRSKPNIGNITNADTTDDGKNTFVDNSARKIDLFNATLDSIFAQNNYWNTGNIDSVEMKIFHRPDTTASYGPVYYTPIKAFSPSASLYYGNNGASGTSLYYFANSLPGGSPSPTQPGFSWRDTTGSTSLIVNGAAVTALGAGTVNDGRFDVTGQFGGDFIRFFGTSYLQMYVGTNGIINFNPFTPAGGTEAPPSGGLPTSVVTTSVFPLWMDFDFSSGPVPNRLSYKITASEIIVTYDNAFVTGGSASEYVSFQVVIEKRSSASQNSRVIFQYDYANTGADFITLYNNNTLPTHLVGMNYTGDAGNYAIYRFKSGNTLVADGFLFGSPLAVAFGPDNTQLPVELASFTSSINGNNVNLNWTTVSEVNNTGFEVERKSSVSSQWVKIGFVNGGGTSDNSHAYSYKDNALNSGSYAYRLKQIDYNGEYEYFNLAGEVLIGIPSKFELSRNYPNPFNPVTKIDYLLPVDSKVEIVLYDMLGREVKIIESSFQSAGYHSVTLNASELSSGAYIYRMNAKGSGAQFTKAMKLMLLK